VHAHWATSYGLLAALSGARPLVITAHGDDVLLAPRNPLMRPLVRRVLRAAALVTVPGPHMEAAVRELCGSRTPSVITLQYGVEVDRLVELGAGRTSDRDEPLGSLARPLRVVLARPLLRLYRVEAVIDALALLRDRGVVVTCRIFGEGPERRRLEARARRLGVAERTTFLGQVAPGRVEEALVWADAYVSASSSDGASLALLEAMVLGAIPVVSDIPANRRWVASGLGGLVVQASGADIARGLEAVARDLDRATAREHNRELVLREADRRANLARCERAIAAVAAGRPPGGV
jgi:glycosyltransferase involved in cell wall biosynthesis